MKAIFLIAAGYLIGAIPTGVLLARRLRPGLDLRRIGSGNIGATNVSRALGAKWGVVTMLGDSLKGLIPVLLAQRCSGASGVVALTALAAFLGHIYPIYLKMKGGKGVATSLGVWLGISPAVAVLALIIWAAASLIAHSTATGALSAAIALPILALGLITKSVWTYFLLAAVISATVFYTHRDNIRRLIRGETRAVKSGSNQ